MVVGTHADAEARLRALTGDTAARVRAARASADWEPASSRAVVPLLPSVYAVYNSGIATGANDGAMWAGRGASAVVRGGVAVRLHAVQLVVLPELVYAENRPFAVFPGRDTTRSAYASPWHVGRYSADLPLRFGDAPLAFVTPGQSSLAVRAGPAAVGIASDNEWWGPAVENAIVMSNNAQGVPRAFARTSRPLRTPAGLVEARWITGVLTESRFFDRRADDDYRALSGVHVSLRPRFDTTLTIGVHRTVVAPIDRAADATSHALDALTGWRAPRDSAAVDARTRSPLLGTFAHWLVPGAGFEAYAEWARREMPRSLRDLVLAPHETQAYTLGVGHAARVGARRHLVSRVEISNLEQSRVFSERPTPLDYYSAPSPAQGYTQRGQVLGAAVGPGGSSQSASLALVDRAWQVELFARRQRHENDALYREITPSPLRRDVSVAGGVRGAATLPALLVRAELSLSDRLNYLFQNGLANIGQVRTVDVHNVRLALELTPRR